MLEWELVRLEFVLLVLYMTSLLPLELVFDKREDLVVAVKVVVVVVALLLLEPKRWHETIEVEAVVPLKLPPVRPEADMNELESEGMEARDGNKGTFPGPSTLPDGGMMWWWLWWWWLLLEGGGGGGGSGGGRGSALLAALEEAIACREMVTPGGGDT